ncbi:LPS assembly lipoprotein LptE [Pseudodesulfovibrio senegalensis]|jgi:hypothetical protein|uniref:DUF4136 domain-containing protein n=1 Tax=Pseudodesulfovibrio senegalensis TaxID=1721087 RepID=A0A6N6N682_9BACT|nr:LPS assembly lipoprotein LptE [Pseudodesulfovibrio senegalensis]KAB1442995.1 hypothetical protein F8A88_01630 [Pseudodesulfovibrio senegalensis]
MRLFLLISTLSLCILAGCGYSFPDGSTSSLPPQYRSLAINKVEHPTLYSWLEPRLRSLLRDELNRRDWVTWTSKKNARAWINIDVERYYRQAAVTGESDETLRSEASITMTATIVSPADGHVIWKSETIKESWPYYGGEEEEADDEVTALAIRRLARQLSQNY